MDTTTIIIQVVVISTIMERYLNKHGSLNVTLVVKLVQDRFMKTVHNFITKYSINNKKNSLLCKRL